VFLLLLVTTLGVALLTSGIVVFFFKKPIRQILERIIGDEIAEGWQRFLLFAIYVVGVSSGVDIRKLEQYVHAQPTGPDGRSVTLTIDAPSMALEVYRTIIQVLQGIAWALLLFFVVALIAFAITRRAESRRGQGGAK
jgi:hypothetical protein